MRNRWILITLAACLAAAAPAAHAGNFGVGASWAMPTSDFDDFYKSGFGLHALAKYPVTPLAAITGDVGWTTFGGEIAEIGDIDVWNFTAGGMVNLMAVGLGLEYGYFSEIDEWGLVPTAGIGFSKLAVDLRYKATGDAKWFEARAGLYF